MRAACVVFTMISWASACYGAINLEFRPASQDVSAACGTVNVGLYAVSDSEVDQFLSAAQVIFTWEPGFLQLVGLDDTGAITLADSFFPIDDPFGLNEVVPPQDGDALYVAFGPLGQAVPATPEGTLLTTFQFQALALTPLTPVDMLAIGGNPPTETKVFDDEVPGLNVVGTLTGSVVAILETPSPDFNDDLEVSPIDLALLLGSWGTCPSPPDPCPADLTCDGQVSSEDLAILLGSWGPLQP